MAYQNPVVGGKTGSRNFTDEKYKEGKSVQSIQVWPDDSRIRGIDVWLTGSTSELQSQVVHGTHTSTCRRFELQPGELITNITLWANKNGDRLGWIYINTDRNNEFNYGSVKGSTSRSMDTKSGIWVGVYGYAGADIDNMGVSFLYPIKIPKMVSLKYPSLKFDSGSINMIVRAFNLDNNIADKTLTLHVNDNAKFTRTSSWQITSSFGIVSYSKIKPSNLQGEIVIPILKYNFQGKVGWEVASSPIVFNNVYSSNPTDLPDFIQQRDVKGGESTSLDGNVYKGTITNIPFDGYIEITPDVPPDSSTATTKYSVPISGFYSGVYYNTL